MVKQIIVDNCIAPRILCGESDPAFGGIFRYIAGDRAGHLVVVYGGSKFIKELEGNHEIRRMLVVLDQAGAARSYPSATVDAEERVVDAMPHQSNDEHILGLARVSNTRILFTLDQDLIRDFGNRNILSPPGKSFQNDRNVRRIINNP